MLSPNRNTTIWWVCVCVWRMLDTAMMARANTIAISFPNENSANSVFLLAVANKTESHSNTNNTHTSERLLGEMSMELGIPRQTDGTRVMRSTRNCRIVITINIPQMLQCRCINIAEMSVRILRLRETPDCKFTSVLRTFRLRWCRQSSFDHARGSIDRFHCDFWQMGSRRCRRLELDENELRNNFTAAASHSPDARSQTMDSTFLWSYWIRNRTNLVAKN